MRQDACARQRARNIVESLRGFLEERLERTGTGVGVRIGTGAGGRWLYSGPQLLRGGVSTRAGSGDCPTCVNRLTFQ